MDNKDIDAIFDIANRVINIVDVDRLTIVLGLTECHENACKLNLEALAKASDFELMHDVSGIFKHYDRKSAKLTDCFLPRFAAL